MDSTIGTVAGLYRRVLARNTEAKPDAANRMNQRIGLLIVYLASEAPDIDVDGVGRQIEMNIPYMLEKHGARHNPAFVADQIFEEPEFAGKELDFKPVPADPPRHEIDFEIADTQHRLPHYGGAAPGESLDPRQQFRKGERLDEIVVPAGAQPADPVIDLAERADDQTGVAIPACRNCCMTAIPSRSGSMRSIVITA